MIQAKETQSAGDNATAQLPEYEQRAIEQREVQSAEEKARDPVELRDFGEQRQRLYEM